MKKETVEIPAFYETESTKGWCLTVWVLSRGKRQMWFPKSLVKTTDRKIYLMPEWMAKQRGLI